MKKLLKSTSLYLLWKPTKMSTFIPLTSSSRSDRSSPLQAFLENGVVKMCCKFTGEHSCWSTILIKLQSNLIEIAFRHGCSLVNLRHIFSTTFPKNSSGGLLLVVSRLYRQADTAWNRIHSKCGKILTKKTPNTDTFYAMWLSLTFFCKRQHSLVMWWLSVKLKWGGKSECKEVIYKEGDL